MIFLKYVLDTVCQQNSLKPENIWSLFIVVQDSDTPNVLHGCDKVQVVCNKEKKPCHLCFSQDNDSKSLANNTNNRILCFEEKGIISH